MVEVRQSPADQNGQFTAGALRQSDNLPSRRQPRRTFVLFERLISKVAQKAATVETALAEHGDDFWFIYKRQEAESRPVFLCELLLLWLSSFYLFLIAVASSCVLLVHRQTLVALWFQRQPSNAGALDPVEPRGNLKKLMGDFTSREETGGSPPQRLVLGSMLVNLSAWDLDVLFKGLRKCWPKSGASF